MAIHCSMHSCHWKIQGENLNKMLGGLLRIMDQSLKSVLIILLQITRSCRVSLLIGQLQMVNSTTSKRWKIQQQYLLWALVWKKAIKPLPHVSGSINMAKAECSELPLDTTMSWWNRQSTSIFFQKAALWTTNQLD